MRHGILLLLLLLLAPGAAAQSLSSRAINELNDAFTDIGRFGIPRHTTALLPACVVRNTGAVAFDTTAGSLVVCNGTSWAAAGGGGGGVSECSGDQSAFGVCLDATTGEIVWEGATADGFEAGLRLADPTVDASLIIDTNSLTAARTLTVPDASGTIAYRDANNLFSVAQTFNAGLSLGTSQSFNHGSNALITEPGSGGSGYMLRVTALTPDGPILRTGTVANSWRVVEDADKTFDFQNGPGGTSATTAPHIISHSEDQNTDHYSGIAYYGTAGKWVTALVESSATSVLIVPVADNTSVAGTIKGKVFASDGSDHQARYAELRYVVVNEADTETCTLSGADQTDDGNIAAITSGTLTYDWTCVVGTNAVDISLNAVSSLTQTTLSFEGRVDHIGAGEPLPQ